MNGLESLSFSANLEYDVSRNGTAKVREDKIAENRSDVNIEIESYSDTLPADAPMDNLKCYREQGIRSTALDYNITEIQGTGRRRLTISDRNTSKLLLYPGTNTFVTEHDRTNFYFSKNKIYAFYFHHSLPRIKYFRDAIVPKTIKCTIEKPFSRILYSYELSSIYPPYGYDESSGKGLRVCQT